MSGEERGRAVASHRIARQRARERRARRVGFAVSAAIHLAFLLFYAGVAAPPTVTMSPPETGGESTLRGLELLLLAEDAAAETEPLRRPEEPLIPVESDEAPVQEGPDPAVAAAADPEREGAAGRTTDTPLAGRSAAERLRTLTMDPRLWDFTEEDFSPTAERRLASDLAFRIDLWADSMAAATARGEAATDWTWTDAEGGRWGVSPGKLHLGSLTLPLPFSFGIAPGRYDEYMEEQYIAGVMERNALTGAILETWSERVEAIRERADRAREERIRDSGPRRAFPDTTRRGGGGG